MAKLRHIALIVPDPEKAAKFFEDAFEMKVAGKARRGVYVSDGVMNVALLINIPRKLHGNFTLRFPWMRTLPLRARTSHGRTQNELDGFAVNCVEEAAPQ